MASLNGVLAVDKPTGKTSHDIVAEARRYFGLKAVGHAGTLDPMATGVLVLLFGEACKLSSYLTQDDKSYRATVAFGTSTNTLDADGQVEERLALAEGWLSENALHDALAVERERTLQAPPVVSAIQTGGRRAYELARNGVTPELAPRSVVQKRLKVLDWSYRELTVELTVSKGYYVRAFARDLGSTLGVPAHLSALRRLASGGFDLARAIAWPPSAPPPLMNVAEAATLALPVTRLSVEGARRALSGQRLATEEATPGAMDRVCAWLGPEGEIIALGISSSSGEHRVTRGFVPGT